MDVRDLTAAYQGGYTIPRRQTRYLVVHHAAALYPSATGEQDVASIARWHTAGRGWPGIGYHEVLAEQVNGGPLAAYVVSDPDLQRAHVLGHNDDSFGICAATNFGDRLPEEKWIVALAERLAAARRRYPQAQIIGHKERTVAGGATSCPGTRWHEWKPRLLRLVDSIGREQPAGPTPTHSSYTEYSGLYGTGRASVEQAVAFVVRRGSLYPHWSLREIFGHVHHYAAESGLNSDLLIAQIIHETSGKQPSGAWWPLSSWWAQRPRRNPAGIGVTGRTASRRPSSITRQVDGDTITTWAELPDGRWAEGISFPTWEHGIRAQVGRLILYTQGPGDTPARQRLAAYANRVRPLDQEAWGSVATLRALGAIHNPANLGKPRKRWKSGWAWNGEKYGAKIAATANELV